MTPIDRSIALAAVCMSVALLAMLAAVIYPTPLTIGTFLGLGPVAAGTSFWLFFRSVLRDLRRRKAL
jgi:hypothetical protein